MWVYLTSLLPSSLTTWSSLEWTLRSTGPYTTCTPIFSSSLAHSMLLDSSNLALSSISTDTFLPFSLARISAFTMEGSLPILYRHILMLWTLGSSAAWFTNLTMVPNVS